MPAANAETCRFCNSRVVCAAVLAVVLRPWFTQANRSLEEQGVSFLQGSYALTDDEEIMTAQTMIGRANHNETGISPWVHRSIFDVLKRGFAGHKQVQLFQDRVHTILQQQGLMSPAGLCLLLVVMLLVTILFTMLILANRYSSDVYMQEEPVSMTNKFLGTSSTQMPASSPDRMSHRNLSPHRSTEEVAPLKSPLHLPKTSPLLPQSPPNPWPVVKHLCPDLVVPEDCECNLLIPWPPQSGEPWTKNSLTIDDSRGVPVFRISPSDDNPQLRLAIYSSVGEGLFAYLCDDKADNGGNTGMLSIHHASGKKYGNIRRTDGQGRTIYTVETLTETSLNIECNRDLGSIEAKDAQGHLVAISHPRIQGTHNLGRSMRIGPLNDAGLIVLAVLGCDLLAQSNE